MRMVARATILAQTVWLSHAAKMYSLETWKVFFANVPRLLVILGVFALA